MSEAIPLAGLVGLPVGHSKSPKLHGHWLRTLGLSGYYIPMEVAEEDLESVLRALPKAGFRGVNVTMPHKISALEISDRTTETARAIGAANTLVFDEAGGILADNTDAYGFAENLRRGVPDWSVRGAKCTMAGAGGAARAVVHALLENGAAEVAVANRTRKEAEQIRDRFGDRVRVCGWDELEAELGGASTVVNATSLGMSGNPDLEVGLGRLGKGAVVTDLVYSPLETGFLRRARQMGFTTVDGLGMMLHQAVPAFESWFGRRPEVDALTRRMALEP